MGYIPNYEEAFEMLKKYNEEPFHLQHGQVVAGVMKYFAKKYDEERMAFWEVVGLLHDLDFGLYPEEHCVKQVELMKELDLDEAIIRSTVSHGYGMTKSSIAPEHIMEKILFTVDELTGIIGAAALMRPSKSVLDMELKSVKKKFKDKAFAAGCSREVILKGVDMLGWTLDETLEETLQAMKALEN